MAPRLLLTGQHPSLCATDHGLGGLPWDCLDCAGIDDPIAHAACVAEAAVPVLHRELPDMVIVQGDTSSALGGARAAAELDLPLAHVEAGLRSFDRAMPWPEEDNRIAIDELSDLLFAPTAGAAANLRSEAVRGEVQVTGNTGIDALHTTLHSLPPTRVRGHQPDAPLAWPSCSTPTHTLRRSCSGSLRDATAFACRRHWTIAR
ncbi:MAG: UDP-N-acetyl glucosamine 2-epimerase [Sphingomonadales bacterium]|nr:UDP-N-acetyl glucosamine 2-epimerase [Sphingomonadales bacterium]